MVIQIQDEALRGLELTEAQALLDLAVGMFTEQRVTLEAVKLEAFRAANEP